jgi:hypothetical protein
MFTPRPLKLLVLTGCIALFGCTPAADPGPGGSGGTGGTGGSSSTGGRGGSGGTTGGSGGGSTGGSTGGSNSAGGTGGSCSGGSGGSGGSSAGGSGGSGSGGSGGSSAGGSGGSGSGGSSGGSGGGSGDGAAAEMPSTGTGGTGGGPPPGGPSKVVLITGDTANPNDPSRVQMIAILKEMQGTHNVMMEEVAANAVRAADMMDKHLLIAGPNANYFSVTPDAALKSLPVPIIVSKDGRTGAYGIGTPGNTDPPTDDSINIIATDHPITTGFSMGVIKVMTTADRQRMVRWTDLGPGAKRLATRVNNPNQFTIVAYDKGADLGGGFMAPAKRVGFFWHRPAGPTADGKKLFVAAVAWALKP